MAPDAAWPLLAAATPGRTIAIVMAAGMLVIFILLAILVWTRLGQARPISKCIFLSLLAHVLLLIYAYSTHILFGPPGKWTGQTVMVRLHDAADDEEAATVAAQHPQPWEQAGQPDVPLSDASPERAVEQPASPQQAEVATTTPAAQQPPPLLRDKPADPPPVNESEPNPVTAQMPPAAPPAPPERPVEGLPDELVQPQAEMPRLTDLLPDREGPAQSATAGQTPAPPDKQLVSKENTATTPDRAAIISNPTAPPAPTGGEQLVNTNSEHVPRRLGDGQQVPEPLQARVAADRLKAAQPFGATPQTEAAVAAALDWLAAVQSQDGRWDADAYGAGRETRPLGQNRLVVGGQADTGVTGLALLAFLGAGETHLEGQHRQTVQHGLEFLLASQARDGNLSGGADLFAAMYCHGMATLALSEAYALTGDERLLTGLKRALQYTIDAQHAGGGWRYQPHDAGDMSQFGWQLMALKSAELGGIPMPATTRARMVRFLQSCSSGASRGLAAYRPGDRVSRTMTAEALVCRYFLAAENAAAALDEGAAYVLEERPGAGTMNFYYWYYGTLAMFQRQGVDWTRWNAALQHELLSRQRWDGKSAGSWDPDDLWGGYGGRIYSTALAALSLEVYYRYLPVHGRDASDSRLTDRPWLPAVPR